MDAAPIAPAPVAADPARSLASDSAARLFIGLWPDAPLRQALAVQRQDWAWPPGAALTPTERLHLTLHFLGTVPRDRVPALVQALAVGFEPFALTLSRAEVWRGGIAVLRPDDTVPASLQALHARLGAALRALSQPTIREELVPHVTLARRAAGAVAPARLPPIRWAVEGYVLVETGLPAPQRYRVVAAYP